MSQCEHVQYEPMRIKGTKRWKRYKTRCEEEATRKLPCQRVGVKNLCEFHLKIARERKLSGILFNPHREMVMSLPMPGLEALSNLTKELQQVPVANW